MVKGTLPPTLVPKPVDLSLRTRAEGDFAAGQVAVNPNGNSQAPVFGSTADSGAAGGR